VRKPFGLLPPLAAACACALAVAAPGCDLTTHAQATGFVRAADTFEPRGLEVIFENGTDSAAADGIVAGLGIGATLDSFVLGPPPVGIVETPLGYSLNETSVLLEAEIGVVSASEVSVPYVGAPTEYLLVSEDGAREVAWLREGGTDLSPLEYEYVVRVEGTHDVLGGTDIGVLDVESIEVTGDRVVQKGGTITLVARGGPLPVVNLVDEFREEAWELVGTVADEIAALPALDGALISVTGTELPPSLTSYAGGLSLEATAYADLTADETTARALVTTALANLDPLPDSGDDVWFLPIELTAGAVASVPAELDLFAAASTISEDGYLFFVDNTHATPQWQIVFVKSADATTPAVLFSGHPLTSLKVTDAAGEMVTGPWVVY